MVSKISISNELFWQYSKVNKIYPTRPNETVRKQLCRMLLEFLCLRQHNLALLLDDFIHKHSVNPMYVYAAEDEHLKRSKHSVSMSKTVSWHLTYLWYRYFGWVYKTRRRVRNVRFFPTLFHRVILKKLSSYRTALLSLISHGVLRWISRFLIPQSHNESNAGFGTSVGVERDGQLILNITQWTECWYHQINLCGLLEWSSAFLNDCFIRWGRVLVSMTVKILSTESVILMEVRMSCLA